MRTLTRRGFTLIELLLSLVMLAIFAAALVAVVRSAGQSATRAATRLLADRARLSLEIFLREELRDAAMSDVTVPAPARMTLSRPIGEGTPCRDSAGVVVIPDAAWNATRAPEAARDDALLLVDPLAATWQRLPIDSVWRSSCPLDHRAANSLRVAVHSGVAVAIRVVEPVELSAYRSGASDWFGLTPASHSSAVQPFAGPLVPAAARFVVSSRHLDITVPPVGSTASTIQAPLRPVP
ncbi:MAG: type II secretion system protein [Gemmatimonadota bacterium]